MQFAGANLEQQFEQVADQRAFLAQPRTARRAIGHVVLCKWLGGRERVHQPAADIVGLPRRRQAAHAAESVLLLWRMRGEIGVRFLLDAAAAAPALGPPLAPATPEEPPGGTEGG